MPNYKTVFFTLGILQIILGISMIIPIIFQIVFNELDSSFIGAGIITIVFGILFFLSNMDHQKKLNLHSMKAGEIMTKNPVSVDKNVLAAKALSLMNSKKITSLSVYDSKNKFKTVGVIHIHNILQSNID